MKQPPTRQRNFPLYLGLLLSFIFVFLAVFGPALAPHDPAEINRVMRVESGWLTAPFRPLQLEAFPLGTDEIGRDLLSRILHAIRPTLLLASVVVAIRLTAGVFLGLTAGWMRGRTERLIDTLAAICLAIPMLVFAIAAITYIGRERGLLAFLVALSLTGWADTAAFVKNRSLAIVQAPYIEGARAIGMKPVRILRRYVLPQLWPVLPSLIAFELAAVVLLVAELGFLGIFFGGQFTFDVPDPNSAGVFQITTSGEQPELGQLLSDFWARIIKTPWMPFLIGTIVFLQIFAFNMLGEGLRRHMDITRPRHAWWRRWSRALRPTPVRPVTEPAQS